MRLQEPNCASDDGSVVAEQEPAQSCNDGDERDVGRTAFFVLNWIVLHGAPTDRVGE